MHPAAVNWHIKLCCNDGRASRIQESYARIEELWSYNEFRRLFDDAYEREPQAAAAATTAA